MAFVGAVGLDLVALGLLVFVSVVGLDVDFVDIAVFNEIDFPAVGGVAGTVDGEGADEVELGILLDPAEVGLGGQPVTESVSGGEGGAGDGLLEG